MSGDPFAQNLAAIKRELGEALHPPICDLCGLRHRDPDTVDGCVEHALALREAALNAPPNPGIRNRR